MVTHSRAGGVVGGGVAEDGGTGERERGAGGLVAGAEGGEHAEHLLAVGGRLPGGVVADKTAEKSAIVAVHKCPSR